MQLVEGPGLGEVVKDELHGPCAAPLGQVQKPNARRTTSAVHIALYQQSRPPYVIRGP